MHSYYSPRSMRLDHRVENTYGPFPREHDTKYNIVLTMANSPSIQTFQNQRGSSELCIFAETLSQRIKDIYDLRFVADDHIVHLEMKQEIVWKIPNLTVYINNILYTVQVYSNNPNFVVRIVQKPSQLEAKKPRVKEIKMRSPVAKQKTPKLDHSYFDSSIDNFSDLDIFSDNPFRETAALRSNFQGSRSFHGFADGYGQNIWYTPPEPVVHLDTIDDVLEIARSPFTSPKELELCVDRVYKVIRRVFTMIPMELTCPIGPGSLKANIQMTNQDGMIDQQSLPEDDARTLAKSMTYVHFGDFRAVKFDNKGNTVFGLHYTNLDDNIRVTYGKFLNVLKGPGKVRIFISMGSFQAYYFFFDQKDNSK